VENVTFEADTLHDMKSVSKSVASLALGIAIDRGLIGSIDEPIFSFFPELADLRSPGKERIRLLHALTMSMGLKWVEATPATGDFNNDEARMHMAWDPCRYVLGLAATAPAGQEFFYNTGALTLVSAIIRKATGRPLDEFARATLFEPLGITGVEWNRIRGDTDAGGGLRLRPGDMPKIGQPAPGLRPKITLSAISRRLAASSVFRRRPLRPSTATRRCWGHMAIRKKPYSEPPEGAQGEAGCVSQCFTFSMGGDHA
jgi:CubicO group peptidase (beta-lactamase class C family)